MEKYSRVGQATDGSMADAHCVLDKATKTHSEYVIFIAFCVHRHIACLV